MEELVELDPQEADGLGVNLFFDEALKSEEELLLNSRFDPCEFDFEELKLSLKN